MSSWLPLSKIPKHHLYDNLNALKYQQPYLVDKLKIQTNRTDIFIKRGPTGIYGCHYQSNGHILPVHNEHPNSQAIQTRIQQIQNAYKNGAWLLLFMAPGMGLFLSGIAGYLEQHHPGEPKGILCLEQDPGLLCAGFYVYDFAAAINSGRILFAFGPNLVESCKRLIDEHHLETLNTNQIVKNLGSMVHDIERKKDYTHAIQKFFEYHSNQRQKYFELLQESEKHWSTPVQQINRVWTHVTDGRAAGSMLLGLVQGFEQAGHETKALHFHDKLFTRFYRAAYSFYEFQPDLILAINHSSNYVASFAEPVPIPRLVWYVDHPEKTVEIPYHPYDCCVALSDRFFEEIERRGGKILGVLPAACTGQLQKPPLSPKWIHNVSYVGSVVDHSNIFTLLQEKSRIWIEEVIQFQLENPHHSLSEILNTIPPPARQIEEMASVLSQHISKARYMSATRLIEYFLYAESNTRRRVEFMKALKGISNVGIYGPTDWKGVLHDEELLHCFYGPIENSLALENLYRLSKVNLGINSLQGMSFINPRAFDVPAAGGFLILEYVPGLENVFNGDRELVWFQSIAEMQEKINQALADEGGRMATISRAQHRLQAEHTYKHRAETILEYFKEHLPMK